VPLPTSPHQPHFTAEQLARARKLAQQHSAPHRTVLRARLALVLAENPQITHAEAAARCGLRFSTVYKWRRRWAQEGPEGWTLQDAPRPGRRGRFSP
jgi:transposase